MNELSKKSKEKLATCHEDIQLIVNTAIKISNVDFGVAEGHRSIKLQKQYFLEGKSKIDPDVQLGKHNLVPSMAVDIFPFIDGKAKWENEHLSYLAGIFHAVAEMLYADGKIKHKLRWGGNWDMDGIILIDQSFDDRPHMELVLP
jgi:peptidoglycan L-alanyl-D-glutamate endopeptidase CwlK